MTGQRKVAIRIMVFGAAIIIATSVAGFCGGLRLNLTPSYPLGIWRIEPINRVARAGDLVFICPPETAAFTLGVERGYIAKGLCPGGTGPLIKTIVGVAGQVIAVDERVIVDGAPLPNSTVRVADAEGRLLPNFTGGPVPKGFVFLHSNFGGSYDSRYFGPIPDAGILGLAVPIFVLAP